MKYLYGVIIIIVSIAIGYFLPEKKYLTCDGKIMEPLADNSLESADSLSEDEKSVVEMFRALEMLVFGSKDKTVKVSDQKILKINNYYFGLKQTMNDFTWKQCHSSDIDIVCKSPYEAHAFNLIQKKMMIDFYGDQDQTDTVKFGIYDCRESNNFLSQ